MAVNRMGVAAGSRGGLRAHGAIRFGASHRPHSVRQGVAQPPSRCDTPPAPIDRTRSPGAGLSDETFSEYHVHIGLRGERGVPDFDELVSLGAEITEPVDGWMRAA